MSFEEKDTKLNALDTYHFKLKHWQFGGNIKKEIKNFLPVWVLKFSYTLIFCIKYDSF